jgi:cytosolic prostaglandin-E synthase
MTMLQPQLLWAQRKDKLYLTVDLQDCEAPDIKVTNEDGIGKFDFRGKAKGTQYESSVPLYAEVDPENVKIANTARNVFLMVPKKEEGDHWPRLTKEKGKQNHIQARFTTDVCHVAHK